MIAAPTAPTVEGKLRTRTNPVGRRIVIGDLVVVLFDTGNASRGMERVLRTSQALQNRLS